MVYLLLLKSILFSQRKQLSDLMAWAAVCFDEN